MKKLMVAAALCMSSVFAFGKEDVQVDEYKVKLVCKVPYLTAGVRKVASVKYTGTIAFEYGDGIDRPYTAVYATVQNNKTKAIHEISFNEGWTMLINKRKSDGLYTVPSGFLEGEDYRVTSKAGTTIGKGEDAVADFGKCPDELENVIAHETITKICLAGFGSLRKTKITASGCGACGDFTPETYCQIVSKMNGYLVGVMNCECPNGIAWDHTVKTDACGPLSSTAEGNIATINDARSHYASFYGTWQISYSHTSAKQSN